MPPRAAPVDTFLASKTGLFAVTFGLTFALLLAVYWANLPDPFVRHDDFPFVLGMPEVYYEKTLNEGRWLNYLFLVKPFLVPPAVGMLLYLVAWSVFAAAFAVHSFGPKVDIFPGARLLLAFLIALTPQMFEIGQWFNTILPGTWVLAVFGLVCLFAPRRIAIFSMLIFVPLGFSAYNTFPFYMLAMLLCRLDQDRSLRDLASVLALFVVSFAIGMYGTYALNWYAHGVFGIEEAEWRRPNYVESLSDLGENAGVLVHFLANLLYAYGFNSKLAGFLIFAVSTLSVLVLLRYDRMLTLYAFCPVVLGLGLLSGYALMTGINVPVRATAFLWFVASFSLIVSMQILSVSLLSRAVLGMLLFAVLAFWAYRENWSFRLLQVWQASTYSLSQRVPAESERIVVFGHMAMIDGAAIAGIQSFNGLGYRLRYLTGKPTVTCWTEETRCSGETPPFDPMPRHGSTEIATENGVTYIRLPALDRVP
ncbi:hypothetical protein [Silicimonas sp. MF1-12-2]|uniref:hypothetical protein n=1 Tax=Silicimonas sp. MF1-12-2 TaxID=3384793 RepID=UPI0039B6B39D